MKFKAAAPTRPGFYAWKTSKSAKDIVLTTVYFDCEAGELLDESAQEPPGVVGGVWCRLVPENKPSKRP